MLNQGNSLTRLMILYLEFVDDPNLDPVTRTLFEDIGAYDLRRQKQRIPSVFA